MLIHFDSPDYDIAQNISHVKSDKFLIHSHPYYELHYTVCGNVDIISSGIISPAIPHGLMIFTPDTAHGIRVNSTEAYERYTVHFTRELVSPYCRKLLELCVKMCREQGIPNHPIDMGTTMMLKLFNNLMQVRLLSEPEQKLLAPCMIEGIISNVYLNLKSSVQPVVSINKSGFSVEDAVSYIRQHYMERLSLEQLADMFYCSKGHLNKVFKQETGSTILSYINHCRLKYARTLLENGYSAVNACTMCGFTEYSSFYRAFVKQYGFPPSRNIHSSNALSELEMRFTPITAPIEQDENMCSNGRRTIWELVSEYEHSDDDPSILVDK